MRRKFSKAEWISLFKAVIAYILAFYFLLYGLGKWFGFQLNGIPDRFMDYKLREVSNFFIAWYLFSSSQVFKVLIGALQLISSVLLVVPKTRVIGAIFFLPIISAIVIINIAFAISALPLSLALLFGDLILIALNRGKIIAALKLLIQ